MYSMFYYCNKTVALVGEFWFYLLEINVFGEYGSGLRYLRLFMMINDCKYLNLDNFESLYCLFDI